MAYMSFQADFADAQPFAAAAPARPAAGFTATEWAVIRLARRDNLATLRKPTRIGTIVRRMFGLDAVNRLADPRLEALRRAAVRCWHGARAIGQNEIDALTALGFRFDQIALLISHARA